MTAGVLGDGPAELSGSDLQEWKRGLERALGVMQMQGQNGKLLSGPSGDFFNDTESDE